MLAKSVISVACVEIAVCGSIPTSVTITTTTRVVESHKFPSYTFIQFNDSSTATSASVQFDVSTNSQDAVKINITFIEVVFSFFFFRNEDLEAISSLQRRLKEENSRLDRLKEETLRVTQENQTILSKLENFDVNECGIQEKWIETIPV